MLKGWDATQVASLGLQMPEPRPVQPAAEAEVPALVIPQVNSATVPNPGEAKSLDGDGGIQLAAQQPSPNVKIAADASLK